MTSPTPTTSTAQGGRQTAGRLPPEERFWKRYSPHHEFPLSSATSIGLHALILFLLILAGWVAYKLGMGSENRPPEVGSLYVEPGGGSRTGVEGNKGEGARTLVEDPVTREQAAPPPVPAVKTPEVGPPDGLKLHPPEKPGTRPLPLSGQQLEKLFDQLGDAARDRLGNGEPAAPGRRPGKNSGPGGNGEGPGSKAAQRKARVLRWSMTFNTQSGDDYLRQLKDVRPGGGAILAIPAGPGQFEVIRDLSQRPAVGRVEDLAEIKRIFWTDEKPDSVAGLARSLGIKAPAYFVAFFPRELEEELVRLERAKANGAREEDIEETHFEVVRSGDGYEPRVVSVRLKK
jgi:hypothetical protein